MNKLKAEFVENLIFYRTQKSLSQLELSGICECGKSTISGIESGKTFPSYDLIFRLADALEIHPADLFLRNASGQRKAVRSFFENDIMNMVEKKFPAGDENSWQLRFYNV